MICNCGERMACTDTRYTDLGQRRRRRYECPACLRRITTVEMEMVDEQKAADEFKALVLAAVTQALQNVKPR